MYLCTGYVKGMFSHVMGSIILITTMAPILHLLVLEQEGQKSKYHAEARSCDRSFVFTDFFAFQSQISSSTFCLSLDIYTLVILDDVNPPCSSMAKAHPVF